MRKSLGYTLLLGLTLAVPATASAATYTVNSTADPGDGVCDVINCTLREAINAANLNPGMDTINFNIPDLDPGCAASDWCTISLIAGDLPPLTGPTHINGLTQPNTNPGYAGSNEKPGAAEGNPCPALRFTKPDVAIDGNDFNAFRFQANDITVEGLAIYDTGLPGPTGVELRFAIRVDSPTTGHVIRKMFIGVLPDGSEPQADLTAVPPDPEQRNKGFGINVRGDASATVHDSLVGYNGMGGIIGQPEVSVMFVERNEVFENTWNDSTRDGIDLNGHNGICRCNLTYANTSFPAIPRGDTGSGIEVGSRFPADFANNIVEYNTSRDNLTAGISVRKGTFGNFLRKNVLKGNQGPGVAVYTEGVLPTNRNLISRNSIYQNIGMGIDLEETPIPNLPWTVASDNPNPNDHCDGDIGANDKQNYPILTSASSAGPNTNITGTLDSIPGHTFRIEFFATPFDGVFLPAKPQGKIFIGEKVVTLSSCEETFDANFSQGFDDEHYITATATDITGAGDGQPLNNTSEFSPAFQVNEIGQGKVTGGGSIEPTAFVCNPPGCRASDTKRANFGVNAQYKQDMSGPEGHTNFVYSPGRLHLSSTEYVPGSLIITEPIPTEQHAVWRGKGKLNQEKSPSHCFRVNVTDRDEPGNTDSFGIKIWKGSGSGSSLDCSLETNVVYEAPEETIRSGNIQVHTKP